jgi:translation initiation factor IF-3
LIFSANRASLEIANETTQQSRRPIIARRPQSNTPPVKDGPRANEQIDNPTVRLIDETGENVGEVPTADALEQAFELGLDLVEVAGTANPPVCKIMDHGKFRFEAQKKANIARKKQKIVHVKEIQMRPNIDHHDYDVKMRSARKFLGEGDKVKVTLRFRGREMAHQELGRDLLQRVRTDLEGEIKVEQFPKLEGRRMTMVVSPK